MAIRWVNQPVPLWGGVDLGSDPFNMAGKFLAVENCVFTKKGQLAMRNGYQRLGATDPGTALFTRGDELVAVGDGTVRSYSERQGWVNHGTHVPVSVKQATIAKVTGEQTHADRATNDGITVYAWEDSRGSLRYSVYDDTGETLLVSDAAISGASRPTLLAVGAFIHLIHYVDGSKSLKTLVIQPRNLTASLAATTHVIADDCSFSTVHLCFAAALIAADEYVVAYTDESNLNHARLVVMKASGSALASISYPGAVATTQLDVTGMDSGKILLVYSNAGGSFGVEFTDLIPTFDSTINTDAARITVSSITPVPVVDDGGTTSTLTGNRVAWIFIEETSGSYGNVVKAYQWIDGQGTASPFTSVIHSSIASKAWRVDTQAYAVITQVSALQTTYMVLRGLGLSPATGVAHPAIVARFLPGVAGGIPVALISASGPRPVLPHVEDLGGGKYGFAGIYKTRLASIPVVTTPGLPASGENAVYTERGIKAIAFDFGHKVRAVKVGSSSYLTGGALWQYDGKSVVEAGFMFFVEGVVLADGAAGAIPIGSYSYRIYPEWINEKGERELGTCVAAFTLSAAGSKKVSVTIPTIAHTWKRGGRTNLAFAIFRTEVNPTDQSAFHRVSSVDPAATGDNGYVVNDPTTDTVAFTDNMLDAVILTKQLDYRNSGEPPNLMPEPATVIWSGQDRIYLAGFEDPNQVIFSKLHFLGDVVRFFPAFEIHCDEEGGAITGGIMLNETNILFKASSIYRVDGDGPNDLGQGSYSAANLVRSDVGCAEQASIVGLDAGVMFKSAKGFYLLPLGGDAPQYVGKDVEVYNDQAVTAATLVPDKNQIRILTSAGVTLLYDYFFKQWGTFSLTGADATFWKGAYTFCRNDGRVGVEDAATWTDFGSAIVMAFEPAWLHFAGLQGFQRVKRASFLGIWRSHHMVRLSYQYNYQVGLPFVQDVDPQDFMETGTYGDSSPYGTGTYGGDGSSTYQFQHDLEVQKCESVRFRIEVRPSPGKPPGPGAVFSDLTMLVGGLAGIFRLGLERRPGNSSSADIGSGGNSTSGGGSGPPQI
jgi:hypothetical protein